MKAAVKTREFKRDLDYDWEDYFPSDKALVPAARTFHRALEGAADNSRFAAFARSSTEAKPAIIVSVSTNRIDEVGRPIRTMGFLRAESAEETSLLLAFFAECLRKSDTETLYDATSGVAKAVESLCQTKKPDDFLRFCRSLRAANGNGAKQTGRYGIPRDDAGSRQAMAESLPALIRGGKPFLIALTDRPPTDVLASLGSMFDHATVHIFSKKVTTKAPLPGGRPNTRVIAAAIGGAVILALLVAAGRSYRNDGGSREAVASTNEVSNADGESDVATNASSSSGISATNALPLDGGNRESAVETWRDDSPAKSAPAETEMTETTMTNLAEQNGISQPKEF